MMKKSRYIYPAIFSYDHDGISIEFPDLPGCYTCADTTEKAINYAKDALGLHLYGLERDNDEIPVPSSINNIKTTPAQAVVIIETWMPVIQNAVENKAIKKTLTIPKWLNDAAEKNEVNFSHLLQSALKEHLGINDRRE